MYRAASAKSISKTCHFEVDTAGGRAARCQFAQDAFGDCYPVFSAGTRPGDGGAVASSDPNLTRTCAPKSPYRSRTASP